MSFRIPASWDTRALYVSLPMAPGSAGAQLAGKVGRPSAESLQAGHLVAAYVGRTGQGARVPSLQGRTGQRQRAGILQAGTPRLGSRAMLMSGALGSARVRSLQGFRGLVC